MNIGYATLIPHRSRLSPKVALLAFYWPYRTEKPRFGLAGVRCGNASGPVRAMPGAGFGERSLPPNYTISLSPCGSPLDLSPRLKLVVKSEKNIRSYGELRALIRASIRSQHPEWIEPNGSSPICDEYDARLAYLLGLAKVNEESGAK
jgi:hypothetical protein